MTNDAVQVRGLGKHFRLYRDPLDRVRELASLGRRRHHQEKWAFRDLSFTLPAGASLGVVGANGAGKSTFLKVLSGITLPSEGSFSVVGTLSSLLELGGGLHRAFNAKQNAFMHAALHGVPSRVMRGRLDEVQEFSELGSAFHQPLRTYSSGMQMRLAFALATLQRPDVLILDEVLAVGDQRFQRKCVDRIYAFRSAGTSIIFVSHSLYHVRQICDLAIWLDHGMVRASGDPVHVTDAYSNWVQALDTKTLSPIASVPALPGSAAVESVTVLPTRTESDGAIPTGTQVTLRTRWKGPLPKGRLELVILRNDDLPILTLATTVAGADQSHTLQATFEMRLTTGTYRVAGRLVDPSHHIIHSAPNLADFRAVHRGLETGVFLPDCQWMTPKADPLATTKHHHDPVTPSHPPARA